MSLIELVVFIVVFGIALAASTVLFNQLTQASVDPLIRKQALALATSMLEEIELQPFTVCDPDDASVYTATVSPAAGCATFEAIGTEPGGETRYGAPRFDNVSDYHGFQMGSGIASPNDTIKTADGNTIAGLADYSVVVAVTAPLASELGASVPAGNLPNGEQLRITVTATHVPTGTRVLLEGHRTRYAPISP